MSALSSAESLTRGETNLDPLSLNARKLAQLSINSELAASENSSNVYQKDYEPDNFDTHLEVIVDSTVTLEDIEAITPYEDFVLLKALAEPLRDRKVMRINSTAAGGGVAIMNTPWVHTMRLLGIDAHWHALALNKATAKVTKGKFHNVLQNVEEEGTVLTEEDKLTYESCLKDNLPKLIHPIRQADSIIIDDWQPSGLIPFIKGNQTVPGLNKRAQLLFRDHIQTEGELMSTPGTAQNITWQYLWHHNRIKDADVFITHPKEEFVPPDVPDQKAVYMPATCDLLDDLNRALTEDEMKSAFEFINNQLFLNDKQSPIDLSRPYIVLVARFDESKGMSEGLESFAKAWQSLVSLGLDKSRVPQFVIIGNEAADDPSGEVQLNKVMKLRQMYYQIKDDIKVARLPHNDIAINALLKNAKLTLQPSIKEGFESRVTDSIIQGVPVIGSNRGGIPLQIVEGKSGYVIDPKLTSKWAETITELMTNDLTYRRLKRTTLECAKNESYKFTTVSNILRWLWLLNPKNTGKDFSGNKLWVDEHIQKSLKA